MRDAAWFDNAAVGATQLEAMVYLRLGVAGMLRDTAGMSLAYEELMRVALAKYLVFGCLRYLDEPTIRLLRDKNPDLRNLYDHILDDTVKVGGFFGD